MLHFLAHTVALGAIRCVSQNLFCAVCDCLHIVAAAPACGALIAASFALSCLPACGAIAMEMHEVTSVANPSSTSEPSQQIADSRRNVVGAMILAETFGARCIAPNFTEVVHVHIERRPIGTAS